jgi:hypothetical protein
MGYIPDPEDLPFTVINQEPTAEEARLISEHIARYRSAHPSPDISAWMTEPLSTQVPPRLMKVSRTSPAQKTKAHA